MAEVVVVVMTDVVVGSKAGVDEDMTIVVWLIIVIVVEGNVSVVIGIVAVSVDWPTVVVSGVSKPEAVEEAELGSVPVGRKVEPPEVVHQKLVIAGDAHNERPGVSQMKV